MSEHRLDRGGGDLGPRGLAPPWYGLLLLPTGLAPGFVNVSLGYLLVHHGVSVAAVAGLLALFALPTTLRFLIGPILDTSLSPRAWYLITLLAVVAAMILLALVPLSPAAMPLLSAIALALGVAVNAVSSAAAAGMAATSPAGERGAVAGWVQVGQLGGNGLGGGLGLWLAQHAGGQLSAALALGALSILCGLPILKLRAPPRQAGVAAMDRVKELLDALRALATRRDGALAILINVVPAALAASLTLLAAVAGDWRASADQVALVLGVVNGAATLPGCIIGGYLCDRFPKRTVYIGAALACALGDAAMAWGPHTPGGFAAFVILNAFLVGLGWSSVTAVIYEQLGVRAAATAAGVLSSISNLPVVGMVALLGAIQPRHGSSGMLLTEAAFGVASVAFYLAVAAVWRAPARAMSPAPA